MVFAIRHKGLESPEITWRRNLRLDSLKLGEELHGKHAKRPDLDIQRIAAGIIRPHEAEHFRRIEERASLRAELPKSFRNGILLAQTGPISAITNFNTGTTYNLLCDAIYLASSGDEIILPAGCGAKNGGTFRRYSDWYQLDSHAAGYTNNSTLMWFANPPTVATSATYLSVVGIPSTNSLSSVTWASTGGGQLALSISGTPITTYRRGMYIRLSGGTNTGTGGAAAINSTFLLISASGGALVASAPAAGGVFGTIGGSPVLNNDRAQISSPVGYLTAPLNTGDTVIQLDDISDFSRTVGDGGMIVNPWGNGDGTWKGNGLVVHLGSGSTLPLESPAVVAATVPIGNPIMAAAPSGKALFTPGATNPIGCTFTNLEMWGATVGGNDNPSNTNAGGFFQWASETGQAYGNMILNNMFIHDCQMGIRPGFSAQGAGVFLEMFNSELWRNGVPLSPYEHNMYVECDILTVYNCLSWQCLGPHSVKSRASVSYCLYTRTYSGWGSLANPGGIRSTRYDFPNGGLIYMIGCILEASDEDDTSLVRYQEEAFYPAGGRGDQVNLRNGAANPQSEMYFVNCNFLGQSNGVGRTGGYPWSNYGFVTIGQNGLKNPELPHLSAVSGGALPARTYWIVPTLLDTSGKESLPACMVGFDANPFSGHYVYSKVDVGANQLAHMLSPIPRTAAVNYNVYAAHADPAVWSNALTGQPPAAAGPCLYFYDQALTLPIFVVNAGGSQPAAFCYVGITYVFPEGESVNFAVGGMEARFLPTAPPAQVPAALVYVPANNLLTIKSPPAMAGATGWYPYCSVIPYGSGDYNSQQAVSKQVFTPIAIGTDWVQASAFKVADVVTYNFYKQNISPIAMGTDWTEPTTGLINQNPDLLKWYRHGNSEFTTKFFAVAESAYTNYVVTYYDAQADNCDPPNLTNVVLQVWSGVATPWPFDANYPGASAVVAASTTVTTAASNTAILAAFHTNGDVFPAATGWTLGISTFYMTTEYRIVSSPQTNLAVDLPPGTFGGTADQVIVEALVQKAGGTLALRGTTMGTAGFQASGQITVPSISIGDVLILDSQMYQGMHAIDPVSYPVHNQAPGDAPIGLVINCLDAYNRDWFFMLNQGPLVAPTLSSHNLLANAFNGTTFNAPFIASVWTDAANYDYTLAGSSPAIGAGVNPGSVNSQSLVPTFQISVLGTPTPGFPIAALTARTDAGVTLGAIGSSAAPPSPELRLRFKFGWDWKALIVTVGAMAIVENPTISRRRLFTAGATPACRPEPPPPDAARRQPTSEEPR